MTKTYKKTISLKTKDNFDEAMDASTLAATSITIQDAATAIESRTLTGGSTGSSDGTQIIITLDAVDVSAIKLNQALATGTTDSYIRFQQYSALHCLFVLIRYLLL